MRMQLSATAIQMIGTMRRNLKQHQEDIAADMQVYSRHDPCPHLRSSLISFITASVIYHTAHVLCVQEYI